MSRRRKQPQFVSLFSGCGGLDLGFVQAGYTCVGAFDSDAAAVETHQTNFGDIAKVTDLIDVMPKISSVIDVLIAGPPCQGFSTVGRRKLDDPRNFLLTRAGEIATLLKPKVILIENVAGARAGAHRVYWENLSRMLTDAGYRVAVRQCEAHHYGVAQIRKRLILVAHRSKVSFTFPAPNLGKPNLSHALRGVEATSDHHPEMVDRNSELYKIVSRMVPGKKLSNVRGGERSIHTWQLPEVFGITTEKERTLLHAVQRLRRQLRVRDVGDADPVPIAELERAVGFPVKTMVQKLVKKGFLRLSEGNVDLTQTFNGKYRRLSWEGLALTVDTKFGDPRYFLHPEEHRGFSYREAARIQGFPDSFIFEGSKADRYRLIGNAVPPPVAQSLAQAIKEQLLSER